MHFCQSTRGWAATCLARQPEPLSETRGHDAVGGVLYMVPLWQAMNERAGIAPIREQWWYGWRYFCELMED
jgi:hypothetical protein